MDRWRGRVAVVTGASSGIGEAIARELVKRDDKIRVVGARGTTMYHNKIVVETPHQPSASQRAQRFLSVLFSWRRSSLFLVNFIRMNRWRGRVAVVTGASSGIGEAIARELVKRGMVVVGAARRKERLDKIVEETNSGETLAGGKLIALKVDISQEEEVVELFRRVEEIVGGADVLVNNAGLINYSGIEEGEVDQWRRIMDVNLVGNMICTREFLRSLKRRNLQEGHIIVMNSVAGHVIDTEVSPFYTASKHALRALSGCLRRTLAQQGSSIKVTDICPGATVSEIMDDTPNAGIFQKIPSLEASDVAGVVVDVLSASPRTQICDVVLNPVPTSIGIY